MAVDTFLALPTDVVAFAWSAPMRDLAGKIGITDVGLRKFLVSAGVVLPPQGHWNRVRAGQKVPAHPKPRPRGPGQSGRVRLDSRFRSLIPEAGAIPEAGPFASAAVPESLQDLRAKELKAIGRVVVPRDLEDAHSALRQLLKREAKLRDKQAQSDWPWDRPLWAGPLAQRQLRIFNAVLKALAKRGHSTWSRYSQGELEMWVTIGERNFQLRFGGTGHRGGERAPPAAAPPSTKLTISVDHKPIDAIPTRWSDGSQKLEQQIAIIATDLIVLGEAAFRHGLREQREWREQMAHWQEQHRAEEVARLEKKRLADLKESGALLRQAEEIRALVEQVAAAVEGGAVPVSSAQLMRWQAWALDQADRVDPVLSGQVLSHLLVPALDDVATLRSELD